MCVCDTVPNRLYPKNEQTLAVKGHAFSSFVSTVSHVSANTSKQFKYYVYDQIILDPVLLLDTDWIATG